MIYVTGDTHGNIDIDKLSEKNFPQQRELTKDDYLIVCGDFGLVWNDSLAELRLRDWLSKKNFTTLWIDGNHENFDRLYKFPLQERFGGLVREITPSIYHLERGQVLDIDGHRFFCMGGAKSIDQMYRTEHVSWWKQEMPSREEMELAVETLDRNGWCVDYVVTHCAPQKVLAKFNPYFENDAMVRFLERVRADLSFKKWFFGHYHIDNEVGDKFVALYQKVIPISDMQMWRNR